MKVGTLAKHPWWGKCIVIENLFDFYGKHLPPVVRVLWNKPDRGDKWRSPTSSVMEIYEEDLTILSEPEG